MNLAEQQAHEFVIEAAGDYADLIAADQEGNTDKDEDSLADVVKIRAAIKVLNGQEPGDEILLSFCPEDVDTVIPENATDEQREDCYEAIRRIDCSSIFDHFSIVVDMTLSTEPCHPYLQGAGE